MQVYAEASRFISGTRDDGRAYSFSEVWVKTTDGGMAKAIVRSEVKAGDLLDVILTSSRDGVLSCRLVPYNV